ncbi:MAG TPA: hypothetical protein VG944_22425, partial [Fimbriimonas sp.]|nr:hypothetical protein [Fimbriimonas sp.]
MAISPSPIRVLFSAGEASGDAFAALLTEAIRETCLEQYDLKFMGIGGARSEAAGMELVARSSSWGAIGVLQALKVVPRVWSNHYKMKRLMQRGRPGLFIPIDFGFMNIRLARHAKNNGWKVLYFIPPGSWRRDRQGKDLPTVTDAIVTPFPWSAEILEKMGANVFWFGHPVKQVVESRKQEIGALERTSLAILPGSRLHEIEANLPVLVKTVEPLDSPLVIAVAPGSDAEDLRRRWKVLGGRPAEFVTGNTLKALLGARAALVCSGTATLEAALCNCPTVVLYGFTSAMKFEARFFRLQRPEYIALPNILLNRSLVPEHV